VVICVYIHTHTHSSIFYFEAANINCFHYLESGIKEWKQDACIYFHTFGNNKEMIHFLERQQDNHITTIHLPQYHHCHFGEIFNFENLGRCHLYWDVTLVLANSVSCELLQN